MNILHLPVTAKTNWTLHAERGTDTKRLNVMFSRSFTDIGVSAMQPKQRHAQNAPAETISVSSRKKPTGECLRSSRLPFYTVYDIPLTMTTDKFKSSKAR